MPVMFINQDGLESRKVRFGRKPVSGVGGLLVDHWAIQVGEGWWEVAGPDDNDGHIDGRLGLVSAIGGLSVSPDIVADYSIKYKAGDTAASGAGHSFLVDHSFAGWVKFLFVYAAAGIVGLGWREELRIKLVLTTAGIVIAPVLVRWAVTRIVPEQYHVLVYTAGVHVFPLIACGFVMYDIVATAAPGTRPGWGVCAALVFCSFGCIGCVYQLWLLGSEFWRGVYSDPSVGSVLGVTRKTDPQIEVFNAEFKKTYPEYQGLRDNCQVYARELVSFLMEEGERERNLPSLESPVTAETMWLSLVAVVVCMILAKIFEILF